LVGIGRTLVRLGNLSEVTEYLGKVRGLVGTAESWKADLLEGELALKRKDLSIADLAFRRALAGNSKCTSAYTGLALSLCMSGLANEAEVLVREALRQTPRDASLMAYLGMALRFQNRNLEALRVSWDGVRRSPTRIGSAFLIRIAFRVFRWLLIGIVLCWCAAFFMPPGWPVYLIVAANIVSLALGCALEWFEGRRRRSFLGLLMILPLLLPLIRPWIVR